MWSEKEQKPKLKDKACGARVEREGKQREMYRKKEQEKDRAKLRTYHGQLSYSTGDDKVKLFVLQLLDSALHRC